ncbi:MAG: bifunctional diaminohydroxyphosphoribosylaminopyrimidine deaminase/5-amino-6-(5-phosphoribosylamino)uracil reductase RibD [Deltaproteobacteria bacterium]|nr:bifunctional diaminohydroxyphosphoribosylaminopyrimidine deaminase/5-amino-6-(5-phosphoribosylamino)uracil reductase RibD [Deltaproteobacteria bacterium]
MSLALRLAKKGIGKTSPNPAVGAVIVKNGKVIGSGWHRKAGLPHAEIEALRSAKGGVKGATLYVTLEPCVHYGRTPPCGDAVISAGIKRVVIGAKDPNPLVAGRGIKKLKASGIAVDSGVLESECRAINRPFEKFITTKTPYVTLKLASTLDGRIAIATGESRWITGEASRKAVHRLRSEADAVMVGVNTLLRDDPELTVRLVRGRAPLKVVLDSSFKTPFSAKVLNNPERLVIFTGMGASASRVRKARGLGARVVVVPAKNDGLDIRRVLKELGKMEVSSLLVEGGGTLAASLVKAGLVDRFLFFISPMLIGADGRPSIGSLGLRRLEAAPKLKDVVVKRSGCDILIEGYPV